MLVAVTHAETGTWEEEMEWDSLLMEGDANVHHVECHAGSELMSLDTTEAVTPEVKVMDAEPQKEAIRDFIGPDAQVPSLQSIDEETARDPGASLVEDGPILESLALEEPRVDSSPTEEEPAVERPTLGHKSPPNSQGENQMEVHTPKRGY